MAQKKTPPTVAWVVNKTTLIITNKAWEARKSSLRPVCTGCKAVAAWAAAAAAAATTAASTFASTADAAAMSALVPVPVFSPTRHPPPQTLFLSPQPPKFLSQPFLAGHLPSRFASGATSTTEAASLRTLGLATNLTRRCTAAAVVASSLLAPVTPVPPDFLRALRPSTLTPDHHTQTLRLHLIPPDLQRCLCSNYLRPLTLANSAFGHMG